MRYKDVLVEYKGRKITVKVHLENGQETEEELQTMAINILDRVFDETVLRHFGMEEL